MSLIVSLEKEENQMVGERECLQTKSPVSQFNFLTSYPQLIPYYVQPEKRFTLFKLLTAAW